MDFNIVFMTLNSCCFHVGFSENKLRASCLWSGGSWAAIIGSCCYVPCSRNILEVYPTSNLLLHLKVITVLACLNPTCISPLQKLNWINNSKSVQSKNKLSDTICSINSRAAVTLSLALPNYHFQGRNHNVAPAEPSRWKPDSLAGSLCQIK